MGKCNTHPIVVPRRYHLYNNIWLPGRCTLGLSTTADFYVRTANRLRRDRLKHHRTWRRHTTYVEDPPTRLEGTNNHTPHALVLVQEHKRTYVDWPNINNTPLCHHLSMSGRLKMCTFWLYTIFPLFIQGDSL